MSSNGVIVTPVEQHKSLLNKLFKFKPDSKLHEYVIKRGNTNKRFFTLAEVGVMIFINLMIYQCFSFRFYQL